MRERRALSCSNVQNSIGAFGGALTVKAVHKLRRIGGRHALIGGGQGSASYSSGVRKARGTGRGRGRLTPAWKQIDDGICCEPDNCGGAIVHAAKGPTPRLASSLRLQVLPKPARRAGDVNFWSGNIRRQRRPTAGTSGGQIEIIAEMEEGDASPDHIGARRAPARIAPCRARQFRTHPHAARIPWPPATSVLSARQG